MRNAFCIAVVSWAAFASLAVASESSMEAADLAVLSKSVQPANRVQLDGCYHAYTGLMTKYLQDLPSYKNIWLNFNLINKKNPGAINAMAAKHPDVPMFSEIQQMTTKADSDIMQDIANARTARQNLAKITTSEALKQIDKNHQWVLPSDVNQIKPPPNVTNASELK